MTRVRFTYLQHFIHLAYTSTKPDLIYPNGLSCSMPEDVQACLYRSVPGLENAELVKPAYGVEYDHVDARELGRKFTYFKIHSYISFLTYHIKLHLKPSV